MSYRIVRFFAQGGRLVIAENLTLDEAQDWCRDPETSSGTATSQAARLVTKAKGAWFDGYEEE